MPMMPPRLPRPFSSIVSFKSRSQLIHPIEAAEARTQPARSAIGAVWLWEDPQLGLVTSFASQVNRQGNGDILAGIEQMLPRPKLYQAEKRRAIAEQQMLQAARRQTANELALSVAQSTLELAQADEVVRLQTGNVGWLQTIVKTAKGRAKSPDATATETLRLESELAVQTQTLSAAKRPRSQYATTLNLLLGRSVEHNWQPPSLPAKAQELSSAIALKMRLEHNNPRRQMPHGRNASRCSPLACRSRATRRVFC